MAKEKVLVVDDDPSVLSLVLGVLSGEGYAATGTLSSGEALTLLQNERFDLVVTDLVMPEMGGVGLLELVHQQDPEVVRMVITGYGTMEQAVSSLRVGAQSFLTKPFTPQELKVAVREALDKGRISSEQARTKTLIPLFEASKLLVSETDLEKLFALIVQLIAKETQADIVCLVSREQASGEASIKAAVGLSQEAVEAIHKHGGTGVTNWVLCTGQPLLLGPDASSIPGAEGRLVSFGASWTLGIPLVAKGIIIGALFILRYQADRAFSPSDQEITYIVAEQATIAIENVRLLQELQMQRRRLERLLSQVQRIQEEERKRISVELHDSAAQWMSAALFRVQTGKVLLEQSKLEEASQEMEQVKDTVERSLKELRRIVAGLHPPLLHQGGLVAALRHSLDELAGEAGISCSLYCPEEPQGLPANVELGLFRIIQEALNNVRKHAQASQVQLSLTTNIQGLEVEVRDDGKGFEPASILESPGELTHIGLLSMRERAEMLGGSLEVESAPGRGTRIRLTVPKAKSGVYGWHS